MQRDVVLDGPSAAELAALMAPIDPELAAAHATSATAPRVGALCVLHSWVEAGAAGDQDAATAAIAVWDRLLLWATTDEDMIAVKYFHQGPIHRRKLRIWQALTVLSGAVPGELAASTLRTLLQVLTMGNAATVKQYQEIVALQMVLQEPDLLEIEVLPLVQDYSQQRVEAMPSLITLLATSLLALRPAEGDEEVSEAAWRGRVERAMRVMLPWTSSFVHASR